MSQIFDALRESQTERSGTSITEPKELLEIVEQGSGKPTIAPAPRKPVTVERSARVQTAHPTLAQDSKLVCVTEPDSLAAEKFRFLGIRLRHLQQKRPIKRLVITSCVAGEGTSTIVANLAYALASNKQKVLLLEGDLRRPSLSQQLGLTHLAGLSELLEANTVHTDDIYKLEELNFYLLPAGKTPRNPLDFMQPARIAMLMDKLAAAYDWIIIDSPPVLPLADTSIWMRVADAVLLVARPGVTAKRQLQRGLEAIEPSKFLGAVLNASREATANGNYYYKSHYAAQPTSQASS